MILFVASLLVLAHVVLFFLLFSQRINVLYLLAASFIFVAPISGSSLQNVVYFKYGRVYITLLLVAIPILILRQYRLGPASIAFMTFVTVYALAALWSQYPLWGLAYKGLFALTVLSGILLACNTRSLNDLKWGLRVLLFGGLVFAFFILLEFVRNPAAVGHVGRLMAFGINPNRIGQTVAPLVIISVFLVLYSDSKPWRLVGYAMGALFSAVIVYTGSRGAAGMALIGSFILLIPLARRPVLLTTIAIFIGSTVFIGMGILETDAAERLGQVDFDTRQGVWADGMAMVRESPVWGQGWVYNPLTDEAAMTRNLHSIYLQVLAETGAMGLLLLGVVIVFVLFFALSTYRSTLYATASHQYSYFAVAMMGSVFAHGVIESGAFVGTTANALLLGLSLGLIDRLPQLAQDELAMLDEWWESHESEATVGSDYLVTA